jgi:aryl-alcohol dehydrogenase-like predicted oxidoreductase
MKYTTFGRRTGLRVSELALGTARFGHGPTSAGLEESRRILDTFTDAGGTTIDTADHYQNGESESVLGELLGGRRDDVVLMTKFSASAGPQPVQGGSGNSRRTVVRAVENSLRRLRTDHVEVLFAHFPDGVTPLAEILAAFEDLVRAGKVLHGGLSNFPAWRVAGGVTAAELRGQTPLVGIEVEYHLADRSAERDLLPMAEAHGLGIATYSPLAGGLLTGKYRTGGTGRLTGAETDPHREAVLDRVLSIAQRSGLTAPQVALTWLRHRAATSPTALVPIVGPATEGHLRDYLTAFGSTLAPEFAAELDESTGVDPGIPHRSVAAALAAGLDGDRAQLRAPLVPVV